MFQEIKNEHKEGDSPTMQSFFSMLPLMTCLVIVGLPVLIVASISLIRDLTRMRRECREGVSSVWYRRPRTRSSLKWIGYSLAMLLLAFGPGMAAFFPPGISFISMAGTTFVAVSIILVINSSILISDLRNVQRERREGFLSVWHRRPKTLRLIAWVIFTSGLLLDMGYLVYVGALGFPYKPFPWSIIPSVVVPVLFYLLSLVLFIYAAILQMLSRRSS